MAIEKSEQKIQKEITDYLETQGYYVIKIIKCNKNGTPDLLAVKSTGTLFVEVKKPGGRLSRLQRFRIDELQQRGIDVVVAFSVDDVKLYLK